MYHIIVLDISLNTDHDLILKIIILIATKELVLETSHDLNLSLYLGIAPRARSWLRNMLHDISFVALILSLIISKQRVPSSRLPPLTEEAPLFVFLVLLLRWTLPLEFTSDLLMTDSWLTHDWLFPGFWSMFYAPLHTNNHHVRWINYHTHCLLCFNAYWAIIS